MSDTMQQASLGTEMATEDLGAGKPRVGERAFAIAYLAAVGVAMAGWLYAISRAALAAVGWIFG
ncbi:hypothetical protein [Bradyrhizobium commune]|uniref:Uncharacterized protein n=1 Tax=Bradyrhizobium commune TaxID=83627 RepID=A0A7S9H2Q5_9BRAD|nr:hypothetical protein [Bradyrhizobium commune]QPF95009.1 hypothetical protein IC761_17790 [Bradyrhizobium commune]